MFNLFNLHKAAESKTIKGEVSHQCDQIKIAKFLYKLSKNDFTRKRIDFDTFTKIA